MPYFETGSSPNVNDMLGKLRVAMAANGWTENYSDIEGGSGGRRAHLSKGGVTVNFRTGYNNEVPVANVAERSARQGAWSWAHQWSSGGTNYWRPSWIAMNCGDGVNLSSSWHNQPGAPGSSESKGLGVMLTAAGAISRYWIFILEEPDTIVLICETRPNKFENLAFGKLSLNQAIAGGGSWFSGSRKFNQHYSGVHEAIMGGMGGGFVDAASSMPGFARLVDDRWLVEDQLDGWNHTIFSPGVPNGYGGGSIWSIIGVPFMESSHYTSPYSNAINQSYLDDEGRSILHPISVWKGVLGGGYTLLGHVGHIARLSLKPYIASDPVAGVGETFLAFPSHHRLSPWNTSQSGSLPADPADETYNYFGSGIAIRRP